MAKRFQKVLSGLSELSEVLREYQAKSAQQVLPAVPPEELVQFLKLSIDSRTDDYLRQLALHVVYSVDIVATSNRLNDQVERLGKCDRSLTKQSVNLVNATHRLDAQIERIKR